MVLTITIRVFFYLENKCLQRRLNNDRIIIGDNMVAQKKKTEIKVSVRNIIEFIMRSGNLESSFIGSSRAVEGTRAHQKVQNSRDKEKYCSEVILSHSSEYDKFILTISGRADGIINNEDNVIVDEIKSTNMNLDNIDEEYNSLHWGQVMFYAYFYALDYGLKNIGVQLTYIQLETEATKEFNRMYSLEELEDFFEGIVSKYLFWAGYSYSWHEKRNNSVERLEFPFPSYRKGQRDLAVAVYKTIIDKRKLYTQAPTGIGKTISTVFPAIKAMKKQNHEKIFYLTAKTVIRQVVEENLLLLYKQDLEFKSITLTAKDKICFQEESDCNPDICPYASGHYDRINEALKSILEEENLITREKVEEYAKNYKVCPFEYSLDLALWVDMIICDYNYVFDPRVGLKRFFADDGGNYIFLVDEAHNLVDRARDMYSADLYLDNFLVLKEVMTDNHNLINKGTTGKVLSRFLVYLDKLINLMEPYMEQLSGRDSFVQREEPLEYQSILNGLISRAEELLVLNQKDISTKINSSNIAARGNATKVNGDNNYDACSYTKNEMIELLLNEYFKILSFMRIMEVYDENFIVYYQQGEEVVNTVRQNITNNSKESSNYELTKFRVKLFCLDPQRQLQDVLQKGKAAVFFSATLTPLGYHRQILGGNDEDYLLDLRSPFDINNLCLLVAPAISTKYSRRANSYTNIADYIETSVKRKAGNYLVFFSSYAYMSEVYGVFTKGHPEYKTIRQSRDMTEKERYIYLDNFDSDSSKAVIGFAVLGGIFSEGVDLKGDRLLGSIVVGVAHPKICLERDLIKDYFQKREGTGYEYAYLYPGINKVLQAAGRTIRTETDKGLILLIGERFLTARYQKMLPVWWNDIKKIVLSPADINKELLQFWL